MVDIRLSKIDGFEFTKHIQAIERGKTIPIIGISAITFSLVEDDFKAADMDHYLDKPFSIPKLDDLLQLYSIPLRKTADYLAICKSHSKPLSQKILFDRFWVMSRWETFEMWFKIDKQHVQLTIIVKPNAKKTEMLKIDDQGMHISLHAKPHKGEANEELIEYLSDYFHVPKTKIKLFRGEHARIKQMLLPLNTGIENFLRDKLAKQ